MKITLLSRDIPDLHSYLRWNSVAKYIDVSLKTLDIGCNIGTMTLEIASQTENMITAIDFDPRLVKLARERARKFNIRNCKFLCADATRLPFADASFEQILLADVLEHVKNDSAVIKECFRLLKPEGRVVINAPRPNYSQLFNPGWIEEIGHVRDGYEISDLFKLSDKYFEIEELEFNSRAAEEFDRFYNQGETAIDDDRLMNLFQMEHDYSREPYGITVVLRKRSCKPKKSSPERVLHVGWGHPPMMAAGPIYYLQKLCLYQQARGMETACFVAGVQQMPRFSGPLLREQRFENVPYYIVENRPAHYFDWENPDRETENHDIEILFADTLLKFKPTVVHFHNLVGLSLSLPEVAKALNVKTVLSTHNYWTLCPRDDLFTGRNEVCGGPEDGAKCAKCLGNPAEKSGFIARVNRSRQILNGAIDEILAVSERVKEILCDFGVTESKIRVQHIGSEAAVANWRETGRNRVTRNEEIRKIQFGFIGTISRRKGPQVILEALKKLSVHRGQFEVHFFGGTSDLDFEKKLLQQIKDNEFLSDIVVWHGAYNQQDLSSILETIHVSIIPPVWEDNGPQTVMESLGAGVPVIGSKIGGLPDFIVDGQNGFLFPAGDAEALAGIMREFILRPDMVNRLKKNIKAPLSMFSHALALAEVYDSLRSSGEFQAAHANKNKRLSSVFKELALRCLEAGRMETARKAFGFALSLNDIPVERQPGYVQLPESNEKLGDAQKLLDNGLSNENLTTPALNELRTVSRRIVDREKAAGHWQRSAASADSDGTAHNMPADIRPDQSTGKNLTQSGVCIAGMHRSGTSLLIRMLNLLGLHLGSDQDLITRGSDNLEGFWENRKFVLFNDALLKNLGGAWYLPPHFPEEWLKTPQIEEFKKRANQILQEFKGIERWGWKDPRNSLLLPFWQELLPELRTIICLRNPVEVAKSLQKRNGSSLPFGLNLWYLYNDSLLQYTSPHQRFVVHFEAILQNPARELRRVTDWLGWSVSDKNLEEAICAVQPELRHHRQNFAVPEEFCHITKLYQAMCREAGFEINASQLPQKIKVAGENIEANFKEVLLEHGRDETNVLPGADSKIRATDFRVSIIIPVYNKVDFTRKCLKTLYGNTSPDVEFEVIVVDNASQDQTPRFLERAAKQYPNLRYIRNLTNAGFAKACNTGTAAARGRYLLFLNNDTEPKPGWLSEMLRTAEAEPEAGIVGAKLLYPDGTVQHAGIEFQLRTFGDKQYPWPYHIYRGAPSGFSQINKTREVAAVTGACLLIGRSLFEDIGRFDESYPMYFEDIDLNMKVRKAGKKVIYCHSAEIIHYEGVSSSNQDEINRKNIASGEKFLTLWLKFLQNEPCYRKEFKKMVVWSAPFFNPSGYASEAIGFALGLDPYVHLQIIHTNPSYSHDFVKNMPVQWRETLFRLANNDPESGKINAPENFILISHQPGHSLVKLPQARYNIGRTMFETDRLPELWLEPCQKMDEIWVPSRFNLETFSRSGLDPEKIFVVPEGIDTAVFDPDSVEPLELPNRAGFNFLSIFEWTERKGWDVLLKAYFEAFSNEDDVCLYLRTYLLGHYDADTEDVLRAKIDELIRREGYVRSKLPRVELLSRQLPFKEMLQLYKAADAFVLPSRGEGWGRPYMEAMAMELPVIGTNWSGNTEFMTEENSYLIRIEGLVKISKMEMPIYLGHRWAQPSKIHLKELMREVFENPEAARAVGRKARRDVVENYSLDAVARVALKRLKEIEAKFGSGKPAAGTAKAGVEPVIDSEYQPRLLKLPEARDCAVRWEGSQFVYHSFALINREVATRLLEKGVRLAAVPVEKDRFKPGPKSRFHKLRKAANRFLKSADVHVRHQWPPNLTPPRDGHWVVIQPWEFGSVPKEWVNVFTDQVDEVWVPSHFVRDVYVRNGIPAEKVFVIPNGIDPKKFHPAVKPYPLKTRKSLKMLYVGGTIYRKGFDLLLDAYLRAFTRADDVCLVIKDICKDSFYKGRNFAERVREIQNDPDAPEIEYIDEVLPENKLIGLYTACDVLVHPYRGEGFGLPILESMACGTPAIVTRGGACLDFCDESNSLFVSAQKVYLPEAKIGTRETVERPYLFEPDIADLISQMKKVYRNPGILQKLGEKASEDARTNWSWDRAADMALRRIRILKGQPVKRFSGELETEFEKLQQMMENGQYSQASKLSQSVFEKTGHFAALYYGAEGAYHDRKLDMAMDLLNEALAFNPNLAAAHYLKGQILSNRGETEQAVCHFAAAWRVDSTFVSAGLSCAEVLLENGEALKALEILNEVMETAPGTGEAYLLSARAYQILGKEAEVPRILRTGLKHIPDSRELWELLLDSLQELGEREEFERVFMQFAQKFPQDARVLNARGVQAWEEGDTRQAIEFFEKAVAQNGNHPEHLKNLADAYLAAENFEAASRLLVTLIQKFPEDTEAYQKMANLYIESGDYESARALLAKALEYHPDDSYLRNWWELLETPEVFLAYQFINQGELETARGLFEEFLTENPCHTAALLGLGSILFHQADFGGAEKIYRSVLEYDAENEEGLFYLTKILQETGRREELNRLIVGHAPQFENSPGLRLLRIELWLQGEEFDSAVNGLKSYIRDFPNDAQGYLLMGRLYLEAGQNEDARQLFQQALKVDPENEEAWQLLRAEASVT